MWGAGRHPSQAHSPSLPLLSPGLLLLVALETFRQSVMALLSQAEPEAPELVTEYSWSLGCAAAGALVLLLGGSSFLLLSLPRPWGSPCLGRGRDHGAT